MKNQNYKQNGFYKKKHKKQINKLLLNSIKIFLFLKMTFKIY